MPPTADTAARLLTARAGERIVALGWQAASSRHNRRRGRCAAGGGELPLRGARDVLRRAAIDEVEAMFGDAVASAAERAAPSDELLDALLGGCGPRT